MKHLISLLLLLGSAATYAQNEDYRLFGDGVQYLYSDAPGYINFGIKLNGTCDTTYTYLADAYACATEYPSMLVKPAFAGYEVCQETDVTTLLMEDDRLVTIYPKASVGQRWEATIEDSTLVLAVVDSVRLDTILGVVDSIKYISFHPFNLDQPAANNIQISKTMGLVSAVHFWELLACPETFELVGVSEPRAGYQYLPVAEFLFPERGQEIHFEEKKYALGSHIDRRDSSYFQHHEFKLKLEGWEIATSRDSLTYTYRGSKLSYRIDYLGDQVPYDSILRNDYLLVSTISKAEFKALSQQPGTMSPAFFEGEQYPLPFDRTVTTLSASVRGCFGSSRRFGTDYYLSRSQGFAQHLTDHYLGNLYRQGVGIPFHRSGSFDIFSTRKLIYLKNTTHECGTPYDFSGIVATPVSTDVLPLDHAIALFPNPANNFTTLRLPQSGSYDINVTDLHGHKLTSHQSISRELTLNVQDFPAGVYMISVAQKGVLMARRRLVVR